MGLLSRFKLRSAAVAAPQTAEATDPESLVQAMRTRARRRLIGAALLLTVGLIGFPLLFESQPRPLPVDIAIDIPSRDSLPPLRPGAAHPAREVALPQPPVEEAPDLSKAVETELPPRPVKQASAPMAAAAQQFKPTATAVAPAAAAAPPAVASAPKSKPVPPPAPKPAPIKVPETKQVDARGAESGRPDPKPSAAGHASEAAADNGRYVVQIGAFSEAQGAREARMKVEGLGLKTYTQVIESATGRRIRVRVGPYASKSDAERAAIQIKASGLPAAILVL